jgi:hypothetical protein
MEGVEDWGILWRGIKGPGIYTKCRVVLRLSSVQPKRLLVFLECWTTIGVPDITGSGSRYALHMLLIIRTGQV